MLFWQKRQRNNKMEYTNKQDEKKQAQQKRNEQKIKQDKIYYSESELKENTTRKQN